MNNMLTLNVIFIEKGKFRGYGKKTPNQCNSHSAGTSTIDAVMRTSANVLHLLIFLYIDCIQRRVLGLRVKDRMSSQRADILSIKLH